MYYAVSSNRTKHIDVAFYFVREIVGDGMLIAEHVPIEDMIADAVTKALPTTAFTKCPMVAGLHPTLLKTTSAGECCWVRLWTKD